MAFPNVVLFDFQEELIRMKTEFDAKLEINKEEVRKHAQAGDEKVNCNCIKKKIFLFD
jgi:hypothetical protein